MAPRRTTATTGEGTPQVEIGAPPAGLGARDWVLAGTSYKQGGRRQIDVATTVYDLTSILNRPDPTTPLPHNRKIELRRAKAFANYLTAHEHWISPSVLIRVRQDIITFETEFTVPGEGNISWGWVKIPVVKLANLFLLDGQHRILGCFLAVEEVENQIVKARDMVRKAEQAGEKETAAFHKRTLERWQRIQNRLRTESIVFSLVETDEEHAKRAFLDINDNTKGVRADFRITLNTEDPVAKVAVDLIESHPLLVGRVESGQSTAFTPRSETLIGAKTVADIVQAVAVGPLGRIPRAQVEELRKNPTPLEADTRAFLDLLMQHTSLRAVADNIVSPRSLRDADLADNPNLSMLGSATMLKVLAGVYHDLTKPGDGNEPLTRSEVGKFLTDLDPFLKEVPIDPTTPHGRMWLSTGVFTPRAMAPGARSGNIRQLVDELVKWARSGIPAHDTAAVAS